MKRLITHLQAQVVLRPRQAAIALLVTSAGWFLSGLAFLLK